MQACKNSIKGFFLFFLLFSLKSESIHAQINYAKLVNPFIGTGGHGHTFPGPVMPFGMVQVGPDTRVDGSWDGCSGYHYSDSIIYGFSHTHLSGTGCSDYGDIMLMPMKGKPSFEQKVYSSKFSHGTEVAKAGYYKVNLSDDDIDVELSASNRVGIHKYTFNEAGNYNFILNLLHRDKLLNGEIKIINQNCIEGFRSSEAWAKDQRVYFRIEFSKPNQTHTLYSGQDKLETGAAFEYQVKKGETIFVKVSISQVDIEGARKNMLAEMPTWDFEETKKAAETAWNKELSKIEVKGGTTEQQIVFYTALYHCFIHPSLANDVDGRYLGRDFKIHQTDGFNYYTVFSLWDTFRALHPLFNLVQRERNIDFIKTFLLQYQQAGRMPMWELSSNETDCMIGYHSLSIIADALAKGNNRFDPKLAVEAAEKTSNFKHYGIPEFHKKGYLSVEDESESVSKSLEYTYDDWCMQRIYQLLDNDTNDYRANLHVDYFKQLNWQNVFNPKNGFMQPRRNGGWYEPFNAKEVNNNYTEANSWQYSFFVPQDVNGLIAAHGGRAAFEKKLDELFETSSKTSGRQQADITGLIGQYAHGNEPSHHMAYLYNYINKPNKTQEKVQQIMREMYQNAPDGLAGNEDCGQMSAWYVFSAMGFYPVTPGINEYQMGSPIFDEVTLITGKQINKLIYQRTSDKDIYFKLKDQSPSKDLSLLTEFSENITPPKKANVYEFIGSNKPFETIAIAEKGIHTGGFLPSPIIQTNSNTFTDSLLVTIYPNFINEETRGESKIYYRIQGANSLVQTEEIEYTKAFYIHSSCTIEAYSRIDMGENLMGLIASGKFYKRENNWGITLKNPFNKQYTAGGAEGLIDGIYGDIDWRKGGWQGYQPQDFEAIIDLKKTQPVNSFYADFLQDQRSWILMPKEVEFYISMDGITYTSVGLITHDISAYEQEKLTKKLELKLSKPSTARYVKIVARNFGKLPKGHISEGEDAFIFVDEVGVR
ncbi:MAG: GH92 family glycosyl hydrolase [Bacteroidia bacterium]|nr:GH92 family glycosyl hydrolase [Bacteroidia bacterium]MCF8427711.1 GH92 family glycosyl hydrolase [Bacteroidia bacterium]MCF8447578.1 GH92 family glycosyl hydrolase [Bacteroidia bacterium]